MSDDNSWFDKYLTAIQVGDNAKVTSEPHPPLVTFAEMPPHRVQFLRRLFPDLDGDPGEYCTACLGTALEVRGQRVVCSKCGRWVRWR